MANKIYRVEGPGGKIYRIEGPEGADNDQIISALEEHLASLPPPPEAKRGVSAAFMKGLEGLLSSGQTGIEASMMSPEEAARRGLERGERMGAEYADQTSLQAIKDAYQKQGLLPAAKELARQVPLAIAEQSPQFAEAIGGARIGAALGAPLGPYGAIAGGTAGAFVPSYLHQRGSFIERQAAEQKKRGEPLAIDLNKADVAAAKAAGLDVVGNFAAFGGKLVSKATGIPMPAMFGTSAAKAEKLANERLLTALGKGTLRFGAVEMPTEIAQQMLERQQAGLSLTSPDAYEEYGQTAYQIGLLGPLGGVGRVMERGGARAEVAQRQADEQAKQAQVAAEARRVQNEQLMAQEEEAQRREEEFKASPEYANQIATRYNELKAKDAELLAAAQAKIDKTDPAAVQMQKDARKALKEFRTSEEYKSAVNEYIRLGRPAAYTAAPEEASVERPRGFAAEDYTKVKQPGEGVTEPAAPVPPPNVVSLLDRHEELQKKLDSLAEKIAAARNAGDHETARALTKEYRDSEAALGTLKTKISDLGGFFGGREEIEAEHADSIKKIDAKIAKLQNTIIENSRPDVRDYDAVDKAEQQIEKLKAQRAAAEEELKRKQEILRVKETPKDEQIPLFEKQEEPTPKPLEFETKTYGKFTGKNYPESIKQQLQGPVHPAVAEEDIADKLRDKIDDIERLKNTRALTDEEQQKLADLRMELENKEQEIALLKTDKETRDKIAAKKAEIDDLYKQIVAASTRFTEEGKQLGGPQLATDEQRQNVLDELNALRQKYRELQEAESKMSMASAQPNYYEAHDEAKASTRNRINQLERALERMVPANAKNKYLTDYYAKVKKLNQLHNELDALYVEPVEQTKKMVDLFDYGNQIRTATLNKDHATLMKLLKQLKSESKVGKEENIERAKNKVAGKEKTGASERDKLLQALGKRMGYKTTISERTVTEEEYDQIAARITELMDMIDKPRGRAKESIKDKVDRLEREIAGLDETLKNKSLPAQTRQGASKSRNAKVKEYNHLVENVMVPARDEIFALYRSMYTVREEDRTQKALAHVTAEAEKTRKEKVEEFKERVEMYGPESPQVREFVEKNLAIKMSPEYKRYKKVIEGKSITSSPKKVAMELGQSTDEYKAFAEPKQKEIEKRKNAYEKYEKDAKAELARLKAELGEGSADYKHRVSEYTKTAKEKLDAWKNAEKTLNKALETKAVELGKAHPDYRSKKLEATKKYKETVATTGTQEVETRRTGPATRKVAKLGTMQTGSTESRERTRTIQEKQEPGLLPSQGRVTTEERVKPKTEPKSSSAIFEAFQAAAAKRIKETGAFRRGEATGMVVDPTEARARIVEIKSRLPKGMDLTYVPDLEKISSELDALLRDHGWDGKAFKGVVLPDGKIIIVGNTHTDMRDLEETLLHEMIGHYGIDTIIGHDRLRDFARDTNLEKLAKQLGGNDLWNEAVAAMNFAVQQKGSPDLAALREIIAHTMEQRVNESFLAKAGRWLKELVGMVRSALRDMGFVDATKLSTSDVYYMLKRANTQFENRKLGPYRNADGVMAFRSPTLPVSIAPSFAVEKKSWKDQFLGNVTGLAGRMQIVDKYAALDEVEREGLEKGVINDLEAENAQYFLRFGDQVSQFATQALTTGPLQLKAQETKRGREYYYTTGDGANMVQVADAIAPSKIGNDAEKEAMLTALIAGERAKAVGWDKLNVTDPASAQAEYQQVVDALEASPRDKEMFHKAMDIYREYNAGLLDFMVQTGTMTKEKAAELKSKPYVPYYRVNQNTGDVDLFVDKETIMNVGNIKTEKELKALVGDNKRIQPIFTSAIQNTFLLTRMALRNKSVNETVLILDKLGMVSKMGTGAGPANASTVRYKYKGKDMFAVIDQDVYGVPAEYVVRGLEGIKTTMPAIIQTLGVPADILRKFITRNPAYAVKQAVRDPLAAWFSTGMDGVPVLNSMQQLGKSVFGKNEDVEKLMRSGAVSSNVLTGDQRDMEKALRELSTGKKGPFNLLVKADALAMQGDAATRAVIYRDSINKGMSEMQAMLRTLESMNFNRRGLSPSVYALSTLTPFLNAQIQGLDVLYRTLRNRMPFAKQLDLRSKLIRRGMLATASTIAYAMAMQDDDDYKNAKPEERYGNWFVKTPFSDEPVKIPIPFEFGFLFKALPEAVIDSALGDEKASRSVMGIAEIGKTYNPFGIPAAVKPGIELYLGRSFYGGDIESKREIQTMLPTDRYRPTTTEAAKLVGKATGAVGLGSPIQLDYLLRGYTGPLGVALVQMTDPLLSSGKIEQPSSKASKLPIAGTLFQTTEPRAVLDESYDRMLDIQQATGTYKRLVQEGRREDAKAFRDEYINRIAAASISGAAQQRLGEMASMRRMIVDSPRLSQERKDELLEKLDKQREAYARRFIQVTDRTTRQAVQP